jgi:hypothetical protein
MRYLLANALSLPLFGQARRVDDAALKNAAKSASDGDWLSYGLTPGETRYSPLKQIDASNVKRLGLVWSYEVGDGGGDQEATPLVWNNTIFGNHQLEHRVRRRRTYRQGEWRCAAAASDGTLAGAPSAGRAGETPVASDS